MAEIVQWSKLDLQSLAKAAGVDFVEGIEVVESTVLTVNTALSAIVSVLEVVSTILIDELNLQTAAIKAASAAINALIDEVAGVGAVHLLVLPLQRATNKSIADTIISSLQDPHDRLAPRYAGSNPVAGVSVIYGSTTTKLHEVLSSVIDLKKVFGKFTTGLDDYVLPSPKNLRLSVIATPSLDMENIAAHLEIANEKQVETLFADPDFSVSEDKIGGAIAGVTDVKSFGRVRKTSPGSRSVLLKWDPQPIATTLHGLGIDVNIETVHIYRSTTRFDEFTSNTDLAALEIDSYPYTATNTSLASFVDASVSDAELIDSGASDLYYAVGFKTRVVTELMDTPVLSSVLRLDIAKYQSAGLVDESVGGDPPDWQAIANPMLLLPGFAGFIQLIREYVAQMEAGLTGSATQFKEFLEFIRKFINDNTAAITAILKLVTRLLNVLKAINIGAHVGAFANDSGGTNAIAQALRKGLTDGSGVDAPAFVASSPAYEGANSQFVVGGFVLVAGASSVDELKAAKLLFDLLAGSGDTSLFDSLGTELASIESIVDAAVKEIRFGKHQLTASLEVAESTIKAAATPGEGEDTTTVDPRSGTAEDVTTKYC